MSGRFAAWRAALRIARRDAWRHRGRSALVAIMVALPVLAVSAADVVWRSSQLDPRDVVTVELGTDAQARISPTGSGRVEQTVDGSGWGGEGSGEPLAATALRQRVNSILPPRDALVPDVNLGFSRAIRVGDRAVESSVREFDYTARGLAGLIEQRTGRPPQAADEVVVSEEFARRTGAGTGDQVQFRPGRDAEPRTLTVVGVVGGHSLTGDRAVIGRPGAFTGAAGIDPASVTTGWYVVGPDRISWDEVLELNRVGLVATSREVLANPPPRDRVPGEQGQGGVLAGESVTYVGVLIVAIGLVLLQLALLAGPAIAVGARRSQRGLAIVAAGGGERRHLRAIVLATSGVIGLAGCAVAALLGIAAGYAGILAARRWGDQAVPRLDVHLLDLLALVAVGALTAVAASLVPARQAARLDVLAALTGRRGQAVPRLRVPLLGLLVALTGAALAFVGAVRHLPLVTVVGIALGEIGLVAATGALVSLAARLAGRLPLSARFALRDAARQRGRTAPAVAAVMAAIAGSTAALLYVAADERVARESYTPQGAVGTVVAGFDLFDPPTQEQLEADLRRNLPIAAVAPLSGPVQPGGDSYRYIEPQLNPASACPVTIPQGRMPTAAEQARLNSDARCSVGFTPRGTYVNTSGSGVFLDDGAALALLTSQDNPAARSGLRAGRVVVFDPEFLWPDGTVRLTVRQEYPDGRPADEKTFRLPGTVAPQSPRLSDVVMTPATLSKLGIEPEVTGMVASTTRMPTGAEEDRAAAVLEDQGSYVSVERGYQNDFALGLIALVAAAIVVTLGGTFTAVGLAAAEGRADHATLAAVGASPGLRRRLAAAQAGVIAGLGAVFGLASGILAGWVLLRLRQPSQPFALDMFSGNAGGAWQLVMPWWHLAALGIGVPLLTMLIGFLGTRSRLPLVRRLGQ